MMTSDPYNLIQKEFGHLQINLITGYTKRLAGKTCPAIVGRDFFNFASVKSPNGLSP